MSSNIKLCITKTLCSFLVGFFTRGKELAKLGGVKTSELLCNELTCDVLYGEITLQWVCDVFQCMDTFDCDTLFSYASCCPVAYQLACFTSTTDPL